MEIKALNEKRWRSKKSYIQISLVIAILIVFLLGCEFSSELPTLIPTLAVPQNTPGSPVLSGVSSVYLPDGSKVVIKILSEVAFSSVKYLNPETGDDVVSLHSGEILVKSRLPDGIWFTVTSPNGYIARVTGSIMVVSYDPVTNVFDVRCIIGRCLIGPDEGHLAELSSGDRVWLDGAGNFQGPTGVDLDPIRQVYGEDNLTEEPIPTLTATETPTETPAETMTETPTPTADETPTETPNLAATATMACRQFHYQYPSTPCPK